MHVIYCVIFVLHSFHIFVLNMLDFQNTCFLPNDKLGIDYLEYNFHFYRDCDE